jgi:hypothetical protein
MFFRNAINPFEAFSNGALAMLNPLCAITVNLIVYTALFEFLDAVTKWLFDMVDLENFGLDVLMKSTSKNKL